MTSTSACPREAAACTSSVQHEAHHRYTANPYVMIGAGPVARKARELGPNRRPSVKTSLAPGSQAVGAYLVAVVQDDLNALGFDLAGYWCTTCMCNIGLLRDAAIATTINENDLITQQSCRGAATSRAT